MQEPLWGRRAAPPPHEAEAAAYEAGRQAGYEAGHDAGVAMARISGWLWVFGAGLCLGAVAVLAFLPEWK